MNINYNDWTYLNRGSDRTVLTKDNLILKINEGSSKQNKNEIELYAMLNEIHMSHLLPEYIDHDSKHLITEKVESLYDISSFSTFAIENTQSDLLINSINNDGEFNMYVAFDNLFKITQKHIPEEYIYNGNSHDTFKSGETLYMLALNVGVNVALKFVDDLALASRVLSLRHNRKINLLLDFHYNNFGVNKDGKPVLLDAGIYEMSDPLNLCAF